MLKRFNFAAALLGCLMALGASFDSPTSRADTPETKPVESKVSRPEVTDFSLLDYEGRFYELRRRTDQRVIVLFFTENGCPIARSTIPKLKALRNEFSRRGVLFWMVNSSAQDNAAAIGAEAREFNNDFPILKDDLQTVARGLGVKRTAEAIAISTKDWTIVYRGAVDDQLRLGTQTPAPRENYLADALNQFLNGQEVARSVTSVAGCAITIETIRAAGAEAISYAKEIAPILQAKCVGCHSPGNIGPFAMSSYEKVKGRVDMIREVMLAKRMPPWHADPHFGVFENDRSLSPDQAKLLHAWIEAGAPRGDGEDPLLKSPPPPARWALGTPDRVVQIPETNTIPATGVVDYVTNIVEAPITEDSWLSAAVIRPDNLKVVHHIIVYVQSPSAQPSQRGRDDKWLVGWAPGAVAAAFPAGTGKFLPKGSKLKFQLHYTTDGKEELDRSELGLYFLKERPRVELETKGIFNSDFVIPPRARDARTLAISPFPEDTLLYDLSPHMHKRGSWFRYEALYPDGKYEVLLSVPNYDFNWQTGYRFAEPKLIPAGTRILCTGGFDNSPENPSNPDPSKRVRWGEQSFEEMFIGFMTVSEVPHPGTGPEKQASAGQPANVATP